MSIAQGLQINSETTMMDLILESDVVNRKITVVLRGAQIVEENMQVSSYTVLIIDASGLGLEPTFSPIIYDDDGWGIYGIENLQYDAVISEGMAGYSQRLSEGVERAGSNLLVVKATQVRGRNNSVNKVNSVVSVADADKILLTNEAA